MFACVYMRVFVCGCCAQSRYVCLCVRVYVHVYVTAGHNHGHTHSPTHSLTHSLTHTDRCVEALLAHPNLTHPNLDVDGSGHGEGGGGGGTPRSPQKLLERRVRLRFSVFGVWFLALGFLVLGFGCFGFRGFVFGSWGFRFRVFFCFGFVGVRRDEVWMTYNTESLEYNLFLSINTSTIF